jgi:hypothetical protein
MHAAVFHQTDMIKHVRARLRAVECIDAGEMFACYDFLEFQKLTGDLIMRMVDHNLTALQAGKTGGYVMLFTNMEYELDPLVGLHSTVVVNFIAGPTQPPNERWFPLHQHFESDMSVVLNFSRWESHVPLESPETHDLVRVVDRMCRYHGGCTVIDVDCLNLALDHLPEPTHDFGLVPIPGLDERLQFAIQSRLLVKIARGDYRTPEPKSVEEALKSVGPGWKDGSPAWRLLECCWSKVCFLSSGAWAKSLGPRTFTYLTSWEGVRDFNADPPTPETPQSIVSLDGSEPFEPGYESGYESDRTAWVYHWDRL